MGFWSYIGLLICIMATGVTVIVLYFLVMTIIDNINDRREIRNQNNQRDVDQ